MKNKFQKAWKVIVRMPMFWVFVALLVIYMPRAILLPAENDIVVVCTGVGIDKAEEGIELSILTLIPQNSLTFADSYRLVSAKAQNIALATNKLVNYLGKRVDLAHAAYVVFGKEICEDGIKTIIEDLVRSNDIGTNAIVMTTNVSAKEMFETAKEFDTNSGEKVKDILYNNKRSLMDANSNIDRFYNAYLSTSSCSIANMIKIVEAQDEGVEALQDGGSSGGGGGESDGGGSGGGSGASKKPKKVSNDGACSVFKKAKKVLDLNMEQTQALNLVNPDSYEARFVIDNYITSDNNLVDVSFEVLEKKVKTNAKIENGKAKINWKINFVLDVLGVENKKGDRIEKIPQKNFEDEQMRQKVSEKFRNQFFEVLDLLKDDDLDCIGAGESLRRCGAKKYREFVQSLGENPNILKNVEFSIDVDISTK